MEECIDLFSDSKGEVEEEEEEGNSSQQDVFSVAEEAYLIRDDVSDCQKYVRIFWLLMAATHPKDWRADPTKYILSD